MSGEETKRVRKRIEKALERSREVVLTKPKVIITVQIPSSLYAKLVKIAKEEDYASLSELVRELLRKEVEKYEFE